MKNLSIFPFERNHYYYGKLLTVEDFELEQRYVNNKRRLQNRFLLGMGVVFGMNVVEVDDRTIAIQPGYALDAAGREIVITQGVTKKLSDISGFDSFGEDGKSYTYLCVEYDEKKSEIIYNPAGEDGLSEGNEYNKALESYRLFLSGQEPEDIEAQKTVIFEGRGIRICQTMPEFVQAGEEFDLIVDIENIGQQQSFSLSYELLLKHLKYKNSAKLKIDFDEKRMEKAYQYRQVYRLCAKEAVEGTATAKVAEDSIKLAVLGEVTRENAKNHSSTYVTETSAMEKAGERFTERGMEDSLNARQSIYLAKIHLVKEEDAYVIQHTQPIPFSQYISSPRRNALNQQYLLEEIKRLKEKVAAQSQSLLEEKQAAGQSTPNTAHGACRMDLRGNRQRGKVVCSEEITHGLGLGEVDIRLGVGQEEGSILWGFARVFPETSPKLDLAAKVYREKGTFVIGAKLLEASKEDEITIYWRAERNPMEAETDRKEKEIVVNPNFVNPGTRETVYIEAECRNMNDKRLKWEVEKYGGIIDKSGMYTAPDKEGVYEITVSSVAYPNVATSIFAVVRERS